MRSAQVGLRKGACCREGSFFQRNDCTYCSWVRACLGYIPLQSLSMIIRVFDSFERISRPKLHSWFHPSRVVPSHLPSRQNTFPFGNRPFGSLPTTGFGLGPIHSTNIVSKSSRARCYHYSPANTRVIELGNLIVHTHHFMCVHVGRSFWSVDCIRISLHTVHDVCCRTASIAML